ncbi:MAG: hypothetical protein J6L72_06435 [Butyricicoccus sp.]|nr:hypothetical protein [Butyricicoccus sp.]
MTYYNEQLLALQQQTVRKKRLEAKLQEYYAQRETLRERVRALEKIKLDEQQDVDRLEGHSLAAFFYGVIGRMDEKLDKEREEAYAASVKYDAAARELSAVEEDIRRSEAELSQLRGCEQQYADLLRAKTEAVKSSGMPEAAAILEAERRIAGLESRKKEIREAIAAGRTALNTVGRILSELNSAEGWGTWDMIGGGLLTDLAKHSHLDSAQNQIAQLQEELRRFKTELADVTIHADLQVSIDGFLRFADYFFDNLFTDWMVMDKIGKSKAQIQDTKQQIESVLSRLDAMLTAAEQEQAEEAEKRDRLVVSL